MELKKLSSNVNEQTYRSIRKLIVAICLFMGTILFVVILLASVRDNVRQVKLFTSQVDTSMAEKSAFINTVASAVESGTIQGDYYDYINKMQAMYPDVSAVYICIKEDGVVYKDGYATYMSGGWVPDDDFVVSERSWFVGAEASDAVFVSEPYVDQQSGNISITLARKIEKNGQFVGVAGLDMYMDQLVELMQASYDGGNYSFLVSGEGTIITHPDNSLALSTESSQAVSEALGGKYKSACEKSLSNKLI